MVDYNGLENRRAERHRGFESLSLRLIKVKPADFQRVLFFSNKRVPPKDLFLRSMLTLETSIAGVFRQVVHQFLSFLFIGIY